MTTSLKQVDLIIGQSNMNPMATTNQKPTVHTQKPKRKENKHTTRKRKSPNHNGRNKKKKWGDLQDGRGVRCGDRLPPHKYIKNTSTCGTTPTEHLLNAGRRPQDFQKGKKIPT